MNRVYCCILLFPVVGLAALPTGQAQTKATAPTSTDLSTLVAGNNAFAFDLYHQLAKKPGNKFFSPFSVSTAFGMTFAGARRNTAKEMAQTLHFTLDKERLHPAFGDLLRNLNGPDKKRQYELVTANSLWGDKANLSPAPEFLRVTRADYQADFKFVNFVDDAEGARRDINDWVEERTNKKIKPLLPKGIVTSNTRLVLVNAIYLKATWDVQFFEKATKPADFTTPGAPAFKVPTMNQTLVTEYMESEDFQLAELMYLNEELSMVVVLPKKKDGLTRVEQKLSAKALEQWLALARRKNLQVALPKFRMTQEFHLKGELENLGMKDTFLPGVADFSGMQRGSRRALAVSEVVHKAYVDLHENGTEAAAATIVVMDASEPPTPLPFRVDHPFLFLIRHRATGSILFLGRVVDPRGE